MTFKNLYNKVWKFMNPFRLGFTKDPVEKRRCDECGEMKQDFSKLMAEGDNKNLCLDCDHAVNPPGGGKC